MTQRRIAVMSGKGGVGKSSVAIMVAKILSESHKTLLLDFDICGPSVITALGASGSLVSSGEGFRPVFASESLAVLSFGSILKPEDVVVWRGPKKLLFLEKFWKSIDEFECVVIDTPPGVSEEHEFLRDKGVSALVVTTPQNVALSDTQRCIEFCINSGIPVKGLIENMSWLTCGKCSERHYPFGHKGGELLAAEYEIPVFGSLMLEPGWAASLNDGSFNTEWRRFSSCGAIREILARALDKETPS